MIYNVDNYGAVGDGVHNDTPAIQAAIDACHNNGGGCVTFSGGRTYRSGTIILRSYVELHLETGSCLKGSDHLEDFNLLGRSSQSEILTSVLSADIEKIQDTIDNLDPAAFESAVATILEAETIYIMGLRSNEPLAAFLHFYLNMIRGKVFFLNTSSVSETFEQMIHIGPKDCFIGISFPRYSMRTLKAMEFANDRNAKVIAITDSIHSPMNLYSSCNLLARSDMVSVVDSLVAPLSVINALVVALCLKCPEQVRKNLETLEETWNNYQVYLNDEIDFIDDEPMLDYSLRRKEK